MSILPHAVVTDVFLHIFAENLPVEKMRLELIKYINNHLDIL